MNITLAGKEINWLRRPSVNRPLGVNVCTSRRWGTVRAECGILHESVWMSVTTGVVDDDRASDHPEGFEKLASEHLGEDMFP